MLEPEEKVVIGFNMPKYERQYTTLPWRELQTILKMSGLAYLITEEDIVVYGTTDILHFTVDRLQ